MLDILQIVLAPAFAIATSVLDLLFKGASLAVTQSGLVIPLEDTALVIAEAVGVNLLYAFGRRRFTNVEKMRRLNAETKAFREEMMAANKAGDKAKIEKLKKKQETMQKMQMEVTMDNFKPTLLFAIPLFGVYYLVNYFIHGAILAISPIEIPLIFTTIPINLPFFWWYMICSFTFSGIITRIFGLTMD